MSATSVTIGEAPGSPTSGNAKLRRRRRNLIVGVALFALVSLLFEEVSWSGFTRTAWLGLLYQGFLVAGLCFALQAVLLRKHSATQIAVFSFSTPLFGVAAAIAFLNEPATWQRNMGPRQVTFMPFARRPGRTNASEREVPIRKRKSST